MIGILIIFDPSFYYKSIGENGSQLSPVLS